MATKVLMLGFNSYGEDSDIPQLSSAGNNFRVLSELLTFERAGAKAIGKDDISSHENKTASKARALVENEIKKCKEDKHALILYLTGHGLIANKTSGEKTVDTFVVPTMNATKERAREGQVDYCIDVEADILSHLRKIDAPNATVILDCCNANAAIKGNTDSTAGEPLAIEAIDLGPETKSAGRRFAIVSASGSGQSAWETSWADVSPCRHGLQGTYRSLDLTSGVKLTNFVGALVDVWGLSGVQIPESLEAPENDDNVFHFMAAANLNEVLNETPAGVISISNAVGGAAKLLDIVEDTSIRQKVGLSDPNEVSKRLPIFRLPGPSREEKLKHLQEYVANLREVTENTRQELFSLIDRGQAEARGHANKFPRTAIFLEDRLFRTSNERSGADFVEEFLLDGITDRIKSEIDIRSKKWDEAREVFADAKKSLKEKASKLEDSLNEEVERSKRFRFYTTILSCFAIVVTFSLAFLLINGG